MTSPISVIDLRPGEEFDNRRKVINLLSKSRDFIWITNYFFQPQHLEIFSAVLKENPNILEIRLLLDAPRSIVDLEDLEKNFKLFQKQYNKTSLQIKFITNRKIKKKMHDRFYYTKDQAWNFIELDTLLRTQRATISLLNPEEIEKNMNLDFLKWWNDKDTFNIFDQWSKLVEVVKKRENNLIKSNEENKKSKLISNDQTSKTTFYIYKTIRGITIESKDTVLIEINDAINELKTLEPGKSDGTSYVGFCNMSTNESLQFLRKSDEEWYAEVPINGGYDWEGYAYKVFATLDEMVKTLESFFAEEPFRELLPWKITRFKYWKSDEQKEEYERKQQEKFSDLK